MWTVLGWLHVCFQPFATHFFGNLIDGRKGFSPVVTLVFVGGCLDFLDSVFPQTLWGGHDPHAGSFDWQTCGSDVWVASDRWCTYRGDTHLAWAVPLGKPSYFRCVFAGDRWCIRWWWWSVGLVCGA